MQKINDFLERNWKWICIIFILIIALLHAISKQSVVDFFPTNGTFQNFNPVRRFFDGQTPIKDFTLYLGFGHFTLGTITTFLFGKDYAASLSAFSFLTLLSMILISYLLARSITGSRNKAITYTLLLTIIFVSGLIIVFKNPVTDSIFRSFARCVSIGASARLIRAMAPSFILIGAVIGYKIWEKNKNRLYKHRYEFSAAFFGLLGGFSFIFSNDYGISAWICLLSVYTYIIAIKTKSFRKTFISILIYLLVNILTIAISVSILTAGNLSEWASQTFQTGGYQKWYYLGYKSHYIYEIDLQALTVLQGIACVYYAVMLFRKGATIEACIRYGFPGFLNLTAYCASNEYRLMSGSYTHEAAYVILSFTLLFEGLEIVWQKIKNKERIRKSYRKYVLIVSGLWVVMALMINRTAFGNTERGIYYPELGGYLDEFKTDLREAADFLNGKKVFSTYATALEVVTDQFQPSKYDYIIHAMGDNAREEYMESFHEGDFDYVAIQKDEYNEWEPWIRSANWFFYEELYKDWHPVYENEYEEFWERNENGKSNAIEINPEIEIENISEGRKKIYVSTDETLNGVASLEIEYMTEKTNPFVIFVNVGCYDVKSNEEINTNYNQFNLRGSKTLRKERIPLYIRNGKGEIIVRANPEKDAKLILGDVECTVLYDIESNQ